MGTRRRTLRLAGAAGRSLLGVLIGFSLAFCAEHEPEGLSVSLGELDPSRLPVGTLIVTEGQYAGRVGDTLALRDSSVIFLLDSEVQSTVYWNLLDGKTYLRLTGRISYRDSTNTYYVAVSRVDSAENLAERVMTVLGDPRSTAEDLYEIGRAAREWARERPSDRLSELADAAIGKALRREDLSLGPEDWQGYFRLASKARELTGDSALREFYVREGVRAYVFSKGRHKAETYYEAARKAEEFLPDGAFAEILLEKGFAIERGMTNVQVETDYYALAEKARVIFGESDGRRFRSFLGKAFRREHADLEEGDYQGRYALARKIRERHPDFGDYRPIVTEAILAEKAALAVGDPLAWNRLAERVLFFLEDRYQAALYLKEAFRLDPGNEEAARRLRELGYVYYSGNWWLPEEFARSEILARARELEEMATAGRVIVGMSSSQVLRAKGRPAAVNISAGGWGITTQWVYRERDAVIYVSLLADTVIATARIERTAKEGGR
ncbi:MAG: hypothetical protein ACYTAN_12860 [Planctomycetota bacterium]|jgi:hypothetical protein